MKEQEVFAFLNRKYVQRADERQKKMGLQYTEAETHDLAEEIHVNCIAPLRELLEEVLSEVPHGWGASFSESELAERIREALGRAPHNGCGQCGASTVETCNDNGCFFLENGNGEPESRPC